MNSCYSKCKVNRCYHETSSWRPAWETLMYCSVPSLFPVIFSTYFIHWCAVAVLYLCNHPSTYCHVLSQFVSPSSYWHQHHCSFTIKTTWSVLNHDLYSFHFLLSFVCTSVSLLGREYFTFSSCFLLSYTTDDPVISSTQVMNRNAKVLFLTTLPLFSYHYCASVLSWIPLPSFEVIVIVDADFLCTQGVDSTCPALMSCW